MQVKLLRLLTLKLFEPVNENWVADSTYLNTEVTRSMLSTGSTKGKNPTMAEILLNVMYYKTRMGLVV